MVSFIPDSETSGMGKWTHRVAEELRRAGHEVELWFDTRFPVLIRLGSSGRQAFSVALAEQLIRRRNSFDVTLVHEPSGLIYGLARRLFKRLPPIVIVSHGVETRVFSDMLEAERYGLAKVPFSERLRFSSLRAWQSNDSLRMADHVICLSNMDKTYLIENLGVAVDRVSVVTNGTEALPNVASPGSRVVLGIGTWIPEKGSLALPLIWGMVSKAVPGAKLRLLGTGVEARIVEGAFPSDIRESVKAIPRFSGQEALVTYAKGAGAFLLPSLREGSPLALLEAMAMGLAPVATAVGGVPEILNGELAGLVFGRFDLEGGAARLSLLLNEPDRAEYFGQLAQKRASELNWRATAAAVEAVCLQTEETRKPALSSLRLRKPQ